MASRKEVEAAIATQPPGSTVLVSDGSKLLASRDGHGDSAVLMILDSDLAAQIANGASYNARPYLTPAISAALRKRGKAERAANRKARKATPSPVAGTSRPSRRQASPEPPIEPEPPAEPPEDSGEFHGIEVI